jgi:hypothetical protein
LMRNVQNNALLIKIAYLEAIVKGTAVCWNGYSGYYLARLGTTLTKLVEHK